jgi:hypothetical protein
MNDDDYDKMEFNDSTCRIIGPSAPRSAKQTETASGFKMMMLQYAKHFTDEKSKTKPGFGRLYLQTPVMFLPAGMKEFTNQNSSASVSASLLLSFGQDHENNGAMVAFKKMLERMDNYVREKIIENIKTWFPRLSVARVNAIYNSVVTTDFNEDNDQSYPPRITARVVYSRDKYDIFCYMLRKNANGTSVAKPASVSDIVPGCQASVVLYVRWIGFGASGFRIQFAADQIMIYPSQTISRYGFSNIAMIDGAAPAVSPAASPADSPAASPAASPAKRSSSECTESDPDSEEEIREMKRRKYEAESEPSKLVQKRRRKSIVVSE